MSEERESDTHTVGDPKLHAFWALVAEEKGEKIHYARHLGILMEKRIPWAVCDEAQELLPDIMKFVMTGRENDEVMQSYINCAACRAWMEWT